MHKPLSFRFEAMACHRSWRMLMALIALACASTAGHGQGIGEPATEPGRALEAGLERQVRDLALNATQGVSPGVRRFEVSVGQLDARLRLAPCTQVQPYLPEGMRLWGKSRIGLRCVQGAVKWNVYLPITVKAFGTALVATSGAAAGSVLTAADLTPAEVDLAEDSSAPLTRTEQAVERTLARALKPGQSLRQSHLKLRQWFAAGETVTVLAQGDGFSVAGEAQALNPGIEGQPVRVRTESGRVLTGQPVGERRVELAL
jgi:flagellar basal body P-ring formation protein FlgA